MTRAAPAVTLVVTREAVRWLVGLLLAGLGAACLLAHSHHNFLYFFGFVISEYSKAQNSSVVCMSSPVMLGVKAVVLTPADNAHLLLIFLLVCVSLARVYLCLPRPGPQPGLAGSRTVCAVLAEHYAAQARLTNV